MVPSSVGSGPVRRLSSSDLHTTAKLSPQPGVRRTHPGAVGEGRRTHIWTTRVSLPSSVGIVPVRRSFSRTPRLRRAQPTAR
jgi:hypothetical protein